MKNPFKTNNQKALITGVVIGSVAIGTAAYLFLSEHGTSIRQQLSDYVKRFKGPDIADESETTAKPSKNYLHHKLKAPKTDRENLFKHNILKTDHADHHEDINQDTSKDEHSTLPDGQHETT